MKKGKWSNLFGTVLAGTTLATVAVTTNKLAKKFGEKPNNSKLINLNLYNTVEYGINKFLNTDDEKIIKMKETISSITKKQ